MTGVIFDQKYPFYNIMMSDGNHGKLEYKNKKEILMTKQESVAKIIVYQDGSYSFAWGFRFYSKQNELLLEVGDNFMSPTEIPLEDGERILGIRSRLVLSDGKG